MKKLTAVLLCAAIAAVGFAGCKKENAQIPNPVSSVESAEDFSELSITLDAPQDAENVQYSIIGGTTAQVKFTASDADYTLRGEMNGEWKSLCGIYETFDEGEKTETGENEVTIYTSESNFKVAAWSAGNAVFTLEAQNVENEAVRTIIENISSGVTAD